MLTGLTHPLLALLIHCSNIFNDPSLASIRSVALYSSVQMVRLQPPSPSADSQPDFLVEDPGPPARLWVHSSSGGVVLPVSQGFQWGKHWSVVGACASRVALRPGSLP